VAETQDGPPRLCFFRFPNQEEHMELATTHPTTIDPYVDWQSDGATPTLYVAFELGVREWKLTLATHRSQAPRRRTTRAGDLTAVAHEFAQAKTRFGLAPTAPVASCYEAGRDGFWLHRALFAQGVTNVVVDSASIEVNRRQRRAKSDRLDGQQLLQLLLRAAQGERGWRVVHVPSEADEDTRQLHRELEVTTRECTRRRNRIRALLATQGVRLAPGAALPTHWAAVRTWNGAPLGPRLTARLTREQTLLVHLSEQREGLRRARRQWLRTAPADDPLAWRVRKLLALRAIGMESAWLHAAEFFSWRAFTNGRQVGALAGLTPTPYASGTRTREQGISKAGNPRVRAMAIEIAWLWLLYQPQSALAQWYRTRFASGGSRVRRIGIVAVARKLLIALWRYLETDTLPAGAVLKAVRM
jgi:transposase